LTLVSFVRGLALSATALSLCVSPLLAESERSTLSERLSITKKWIMSAPSGKSPPDCIETWLFEKDGMLTIESGAERMKKQWRLGHGSDSTSLYMRRLSSTGGLDCVGDAAERFDQPKPEEDQPLWLLEFNSGDDILLCDPQYVINSKTKKHTPMYNTDSCWGKLKPAR
jgi:hypothetical protein